VHPTESGSAYPKENKAVDRMLGTTRQAFIKSVDTVSIWLKSGGLLPFGPSSCTKSEEEPQYLRLGRPEPCKSLVSARSMGTTAYWTDVVAHLIGEENGRYPEVVGRLCLLGSRRFLSPILFEPTFRID
jgi:hypothetical protein